MSKVPAGGSANLWGLKLQRIADGSFLASETLVLPTEHSRDVVLEPVDLWTAGQDRRLLGRLLPDSWENAQTGWIHTCLLFFSPNEATWKNTELLQAPSEDIACCLMLLLH